jgi:hypothetical protein
MRNNLGTRHSLPNTRKLTIIAQDPSVEIRGKILTSEVEIPAEQLAPGPCGYRVNVIDYDTSTNTLYQQAKYPSLSNGASADPFRLDQSKKRPKNYDRRLLQDPRFHAQNVYAIIMRTLARFEFALGRRVAWGSAGHQLHIAPHAFADANAFYSKEDRGIFFGYFMGRDGSPIFTCLSHDVVAHETTHALLDGLRGRYMESSSPDQAAFHEGIADIVALLSMFSLPEVVDALLDLGAGRNQKLIGEKYLERKYLKEKNGLLGLAEQMGPELTVIRGNALRRSVELPPGKPYMSMPGFQEAHRRGELIVAATMNAFLDIWLARLEKVGTLQRGKKDRSLVRDQGVRVADHLLTMVIRALDYCPPVDLRFSDYLSALLTVDREVVPDDTKYNYRDALLKNFKAFDIVPANNADTDGTWKRCDRQLIYSRTHFDSILRSIEEVFRFIWENRGKNGLDINKDGYIEVESVWPSIRIGPDGFVLHETVAEYVQILTLRADELPATLRITPPDSIQGWQRIRIFGGGTLVFDDTERQQSRLNYLAEIGFFETQPEPSQLTGNLPPFAQLHLARAMG